MVKINSVLQRQGEKGEFVVLELTGDFEMVQSQNTGRFYATVRKCSIPCTLGLEEAKAFIGKEMPGAIQKLECEPYEYTVESTGEVITLNHRWEYLPEGKTTTPVVEMKVA
jgi:hypothetical protein